MDGSWFRKIIKKSQINIEISLKRYRSTLWEELYRLVISAEEHNERILNLSYEKGELENLLSSIDYPRSLEIVQNPDLTQQHITNLFNWYLSLPYEKRTTQIRFAVRRIEDILEHIQMKQKNIPSRKFSMEDARKTLEEFSNITLVNMQKIKNLIESKIQKIKQWNGSFILIEAAEYDKDQDLGPEDSARIYVGGEHGPMFSLFVMGESYEIDDIMDGAEDIEEFLDQKTKYDYFSLINALQNKSKVSEKLILYTARPVKDRKFYEDNIRLPANIYLTDNFNRASGIALELAREDKYRDIWKVKLSAYDVVVTFDGGTFKDYMTIKEVQPDWMRLISAGE